MAVKNDPVERPVKTTAEIEATPKGVVRRWLAELQLADLAEEDFRKEAKEAIEIYDGLKRGENAFNILISNTETLQPAVYNSTPKPDVRRRFRDPDMVGKVSSNALERALSYQIDDYDFDTEMVDVTLDVLLPGRGVARIRYEPHFAQVTPQGMQPALPGGSMVPDASVNGENPTVPPSQEGGVPVAGASGNMLPGQTYEKLIGQSAECVHVQWDKFRRGRARDGKTFRG